MIGQLFSIGLFSLLGQVAILRELHVAFYGVELVYLVALGIWLLATAAGAALGRTSSIPESGRTTFLFIILAVILPCDVAFIRASRLLFGGIPGAYLPLHRQFLIAFLSLVPVGAILGFLFTRIARGAIHGGRGTLARAYAIESVGAVAGGILGTAALIWGMSNLSLTLALCLCPLFISASAFHDGDFSRPLVLVSGGAGAVILIALWHAPLLDIATAAWNHRNVAASADTPYGRVVVTGQQGQIGVFENDALSFETQGTEAELFSHLTALQHPHPREILLLGAGAEGLVRELQQHAPARIDYVEINPAMLRLVLPHLPSAISSSLEAPNVRIFYTDPRAYLADCGRYDLILVGMPEPASVQANRVYTAEFFALCAKRLKQGGILGLRLPGGENYLTPAMAERMASIHAALAVTFSQTLFLPGATTVITASRHPLPQSPEILIERWHTRGISGALTTPPYLRYVFTNDRFSALHTLLVRTDAPPNTDVRPLCYRYTLTVWLSKFFPELASSNHDVLTPRLPAATADKALVFPSLFGPIPLTITGVLALLFLIVRGKPALRLPVLVAAAAFAGMTAETILLLSYQITSGVLFRDIGLLLTFFMAGLALGAYVIDMLSRRVGLSRRLLAFLLGGFLCHGAVMAGHLAAGYAFGMAASSLLLALAGFLVAGIFAWAGHHGSGADAVAPLYAADLLGGCIGSLAAGLVLIPFAGLDTAAVWIVLAIALSCLLL